MAGSYRRSKSGSTTYTTKKGGGTTTSTSTSGGTGSRITFTRKADGRQIRTETRRSVDGYVTRTSKTLVNPNKKPKKPKAPKPARAQKFPKIKIPKIKIAKPPKPKTPRKSKVGTGLGKAIFKFLFG